MFHTPEVAQCLPPLFDLNEGFVLQLADFEFAGKGLPISEGVKYAPWLVAEMPAAPLLESPQCGVTNQSRIQVSGQTSPEAMVQAYDRDVAVGSPVRAQGDGSFSFELTLADGEHRLTFDANRHADHRSGAGDGQPVQGELRPAGSAGGAAELQRRLGDVGNRAVPTPAGHL